MRVSLLTPSCLITRPRMVSTETPLNAAEELHVRLSCGWKTWRKFPVEKVRAISGSAQQHGSVYWRQGAKQMLQSLNPSHTLASQLECAFSVKDTPIWMDSSSTQQCRNIEEALGGAQALSELTGSRALERYTGPQIQKLHQTQEDVYNSTERISLISSFMACLLIGGYASIVCTDGAGMTRGPKDPQMDANSSSGYCTEPGVEPGELVAPHAVAGKLHSCIKRSDSRRFLKSSEIELFEILASLL